MGVEAWQIYKLMFNKREKPDEEIGFLHPGLIVSIDDRSGEGTVVMGTSKKLDLVASDEYVVVDWAAAGLEKPTKFQCLHKMPLKLSFLEGKEMYGTLGQDDRAGMRCVLRAKGFCGYASRRSPDCLFA